MKKTDHESSGSAAVPDRVCLPAHADQQNIVLIVVDDLSKEWINCYGADDITTPRIDQLGAGDSVSECVVDTSRHTHTRNCTPPAVSVSIWIGE